MKSFKQIKGEYVHTLHAACWSSDDWSYLVVSFGRGEVERRVEAAEGGAPREPRVRLQQPPHLRRVAVPRGGRQPLAEAGAPQGVAHALAADRSRRPPPPGFCLS